MLGPMFTAFVAELWAITLELAWPLLLGLLLAGLLHVLLPTAFVRQQLSRPTFGSVLRAVLIGVPLPLCSCGVVPTAIGLKQQGASRGAATGFLISTPQTGVDSVLVSATFLGWPFALFKVAAAALTGLIGGALVNRLERGAPAPAPAEQELVAAPRRHPLEVVRYAVFDLLAMIDLWLVVGVGFAALLGVLLPDDFFARHAWTQGLGGMLLVLVIALPLYVCTTSSVPIAASLIAAGMPAGAALVFLMAGPATNVATLGAVWRGLGGRVLAVYLGTVTVMSLGLGWLFDFVLAGARAPHHLHAHGASWLEQGSAALLVALLAFLLGRRLWLRLRSAAPLTQESAMDLTLKVDGMTCQHCVANVKRALEAVDKVAAAEPDLATGRVVVRGEQPEVAKLIAAVEAAGYRAAAG